jgi:hypothetical protein
MRPALVAAWFACVGFALGVGCSMKPAAGPAADASVDLSADASDADECDSSERLSDACWMIGCPPGEGISHNEAYQYLECFPCAAYGGQLDPSTGECLSPGERQCAAAAFTGSTIPPVTEICCVPAPDGGIDATAGRDSSTSDAAIEGDVESGSESVDASPE